MLVECDLPSSLLQHCFVCAAVSAAVLHASYLGPAETGARTPRRAAEGQSEARTHNIQITDNTVDIMA